MKPRYWTCGCGRKNVSREAGRPVCAGCGKDATFAIAPPRGQGGFDFGGAQARLEDEDMRDRVTEGKRRRDSKTLCACGHEERRHFSTAERGCHWSDGTGSNYRDCECDGFTPSGDKAGGD